MLQPLAHKLAPFVGREAELAAIGGALDAGARLITLVGSAGFGKTRLARELLRLRGAADVWPGGAYFCDLRSAETVDDLHAALARAIDLPLGATRSPAAVVERLCAHLAAAGPVLVVADNLEHILDPARQALAAWLTAAPGLVVLATSREALALPGERIHAVGPLPSSATSEASPFEAPAVRLFLNTAAHAGGATGVMEGRPETLAAIVKLIGRLDGNPLAIELAAARTTLLTPRQLLTRMDRRFEVLRDGNVDGDRTLWDAIDDSWQALELKEQRVLMQLAVFRGGADVEMVEALLAGDPAYAGAGPMDLLAALIRKSLVVVREISADGRRRLDLYESIRAFARTQLAASPIDEAELCDRHAAAAIVLARDIASRYAGPDADNASADFSVELANLFVGLEHAVRPGATTAFRIAAVEVLADLRFALREHVSVDVEHAVLAAAVAGGESLPAGLRIRLIGDLAYTLINSGKADAAERHLEDALAIGVASGDARLEALALSNFGFFAEHRPPEVLLPKLTRALEQLEPGYWASYTRSMIGLHLIRAKEFDAAEAHLAQASDELRKTDTGGRYYASVLNNYALLTGRRGAWDVSRRLLRRAIDAARRSRFPILAGIAMTNLGECEMREGRYAAARALFEESQAIARKFGHARPEAMATANLAGIMHFSGELDAAYAGYTAALAGIARTWDDPVSEGLVRTLRALIDAQFGREDASDDGFDAAHACLVAAGDAMLMEAHAIHRLAAAAVLGRKSPAEALAESGAVLARATELSLTIPPPNRVHQVQHARTLLGRILETLDPSLAEAASAPGASITDQGRPKAHLILGTGGRSLTLQGGESLDLARSPRTRGLVGLLVERRLAAPGTPVDIHDLYDAGWPGDQTPEPYRSNRVYVALTRLRKAGFEDVLLHDGDGYLLDPATPVTRES